MMSDQCAVLLEYSFADRSTASAVGGRLQRRGLHILYTDSRDQATPHGSSVGSLPLIALLTPAFFTSPYCSSTLQDAQDAGAPIVALVSPGLELGALADYPHLQQFHLTRTHHPAVLDGLVECIARALPTTASSTPNGHIAPTQPAYIEDPLPDIALTSACAFDVILDWAEHARPMDRTTLRHVIEMLAAHDLEMSVWLLTGIARSGDWRRRRLATLLLQMLPVPLFGGLEDVLFRLDSGIGEKTARALESLGSAVLPSLIHLARSPSWKIRRSAAWAMGIIQDKAATPALIKLLRDDDADVARSALLALGEINESIRIKHIRAQLGHGNFRIAETAATVLAYSGSAGINALYASINDSNPDIRIMAISGLQRLDTVQEAIRAIIEAASDPDPDVRLVAVKALGEIRTDEAVRQLFKSLKDRYISSRANQRISEVAERILRSLGYIGRNQRSSDEAKIRLNEALTQDRTKNGSTVPQTVKPDIDEGLATLIEGLASPLPSARIQAIRRLAELESNVATLAIIPRLADDDPQVAQVVSSALRRISSQALPFMIEMIGTENLTLRGAIITCLGGFLNDTAVNLIVSCVKDTRPVQLPSYTGTIGALAYETLSKMPLDSARDAVVRIDAAQLITQAKENFVEGQAQYNEQVKRGEETLSLPDAFTAFEGMLDKLRKDQWADQQTAVRELKEQAAAMYEHNPTAVLNFLRTHSNDKNWTIRWVCTEVLSMVRVKEAANIIVPRLQDSNWTVQIAALRALVEIGDRSVTGSIAPLVRDPNASVREAAVESLGALGPEKHLHHLIEAAQKDASEFVRLAAVDALGSVDNHKLVLPVLAAALKDASVDVRWTAAHILSHIADQTITKELADSLGDEAVPHWEQERVCDLCAKALKSIDTLDARRALEKWGIKNRPSS